MSETTNTATKTAAKAAAAVSETLPTVVQTSEFALEVPTKVVLNQRMVVIAGVTAGIALGAGAVIGWNKFKAYKAKKDFQADVETVEDPIVK